MSEITGSGRIVIGLRESTHGTYADNAKVAQEIKDIMRGGLNWGELSPVQRESLDLIATKIGRILSGDPDEPDHWADCSGYCELVLNHIAAK